MDQAGLLAVEGGYEVWLHAQCAEWAPGLCIIGTQVVGLDDAVWAAVRTVSPPNVLPNYLYVLL